jgi:hypothetical protein
MGLKEAFQKVAQTGMKAAGNISIPVIYRSMTSDPTYNPTTGEVTEHQLAYKTNMLFDENLSEDIKNIAIDINEKLGYIAVKDLVPIPKTDDRIEIDYIEWSVMEVHTDPADALWIIKIKKQ